MARMVWFWMGPDAYTDPKLVDGLNAKAGYLWQMGALDFAGGTVVHINAGVAGLVAAYFLGKRIGFGKEALTPHSLTMTMIGASLLWFGWFGFNAGSALEAGNSAVLAFMNTFLATACAVLSWTLAEWLLKGKPSMLGAASGAVAGLDDSLDVFGVHAVGGILGALLTGVFVSPDLGGPGFVTDWVKATTGFTSIGEQLVIQAKAVAIAVVWSGVVAAVSLFIVKMVVGLRVPEDEEREGLDITSHGETAYN